MGEDIVECSPHSCGRELTSTTTPLISIQVLRAVAALAIVFAHLWPTFVFLGLPTAVANFLLGAAGVDLFFVISGFIMVYTSKPLFSQPGAPLYFFVRRIVRIVPLYWAATTVVLIFYLKTSFDLSERNLTWMNVIASYLFLPLPHLNGQTEPILGVGWTLNYEMFFYVVFAFATLLSQRWAVLAVTAFFIAVLTLPGALAIPIVYPFAGWVFIHHL